MASSINVEVPKYLQVGEDMLDEIFQYLDYSDIKHVQLTCKFWHNVCNKNKLWKRFCFNAGFRIGHRDDIKRVTGPLPLKMRALHNCDTYDVLQNMCDYKYFFHINKYVEKNWKHGCYTQESMEFTLSNEVGQFNSIKHNINKPIICLSASGYSDDLFVYSYRKPEPEDPQSIYICIYALNPLLHLQEFKFLFHSVERIQVCGSYIFVQSSSYIVVYYLETYLYTIIFEEDKHEVCYKRHPVIKGDTKNKIRAKSYLDNLQFYKDQFIIMACELFYISIHNISNGQLNYHLHLHKYTIVKLHSVYVISDSSIFCTCIDGLLMCFELDEKLGVGFVEQSLTQSPVLPTLNDELLSSPNKFIDPPIVGQKTKNYIEKWNYYHPFNFSIFTYSRKYIFLLVQRSNRKRFIQVLNASTGDLVIDTKEMVHLNELDNENIVYSSFSFLTNNNELRLWGFQHFYKIKWSIPDTNKIIVTQFQGTNLFCGTICRSSRIWGNSFAQCEQYKDDKSVCFTLKDIDDEEDDDDDDEEEDDDDEEEDYGGDDEEDYGDDEEDDYGDDEVEDYGDDDEETSFESKVIDDDKKRLTVEKTRTKSTVEKHVYIHRQLKYILCFKAECREEIYQLKIRKINFV